MRLTGPEDLLQGGAMRRVGVDLAEGTADHILLGEAHLGQLRGTHHRVAELGAEQHADACGRVTECFVETETLGLGFRARPVERDIRARDTPAEVPRDPERREQPDEREQDRRAGQPVGKRERRRRRLREDDDPTRLRCGREGNETLAAGGVAREDRV